MFAARISCVCVYKALIISTIVDNQLYNSKQMVYKTVIISTIVDLRGEGRARTSIRHL